MLFVTWWMMVFVSWSPTCTESFKCPGRDLSARLVDHTSVAVCSHCWNSVKVQLDLIFLLALSV